jgi:threonine dehydrogenase-like Zn-dependent dehydrogenase
MDATSFWVEGPRRGALRTAPLPEPGLGEVRVAARVSGISRGTELLVFRHGVPESQHEAMRAPFMEGAFPAPVKYGYASVGVIDAGPAGRVGQAVFCLHPHQDRYVVPASAVRPLPDGLPFERAVLAANVETALNATWDAGVGPGDRVTVIGGGVVGLSIARLCARMPGTEVEVVDVEPTRAEIASALGARFASPEDAEGERDVVIHASASEAGLRGALELAAVEATVLEVSWFGDREVRLPLGEAFHSRRLVLRSSQVGRVPAARAARWTHARRLEAALRILAEDASFDALLDGESAFAALPETMAALEGRPSLCHVVRY